MKLSRCISLLILTCNTAIQFTYLAFGKYLTWKHAEYIYLKVSDTSASVGTQDTEICHVSENKLTLSSFTDNSP
jgi:hypothetical protein